MLRRRRRDAGFVLPARGRSNLLHRHIQAKDVLLFFQWNNFGFFLDSKYYAGPLCWYLCCLSVMGDGEQQLPGGGQSAGSVVL